jgi:hypothetical protein
MVVGQTTVDLVVVPAQAHVADGAVRDPTATAMPVPARAEDAVARRWLVEEVAPVVADLVPGAPVLEVPDRAPVVAASTHKLPSSIASSIRCCENWANCAASAVIPAVHVRPWVALVLADLALADLALDEALASLDSVAPVSAASDRRSVTCVALVPAAQRNAAIVMTIVVRKDVVRKVRATASGVKLARATGIVVVRRKASVAARQRKDAEGVTVQKVVPTECQKVAL